MSKVCLKQQLTYHTKEIDQLIKELPPNDPVKDWFFVELDALTTGELAETLSLDEENSRLRALLSLGASKPATHGRFKTSRGVNVQ